MGIEIGAAYVISALVAADATAYGQKKASKANDKALDLSTRASREQLDYLKQKEAQDQANFDKTFDENRHEWQTTQDRNFEQYQQREGQLTPYREQSLAANNTLADLLGFPHSSAPPPRSAPPHGSAPDVSPDAIGPIPATVEEAMAKANQIAYGGRAKHTDPGYWKTWATDPVYTYKRMLGYQAGGDDVPTSGPYAGSAGPAAPAGAPVAASAPLGRLMMSGGAVPANPSATPSTNTLSNLVRTPAPAPIDAMTLYQLMTRAGQQPSV